MKSRVALIVLLVFAAATADATTSRDPKQRAAFLRTHPCPATGLNYGACPGWVVDHIYPLCKGGRDDITNMQWQAVDDAKAKDKWECIYFPVD